MPRILQPRQGIPSRCPPMPEPDPITRDVIVRALAAALEPLSWVDALWEGGSAAFGRADAWSDADLYVVVEDDKLEEAFRVVEGALTRLSPIRTKYQPLWSLESGTAQAFYRLERATEYLLIDLAVFKRSARDKYLEPELHGQAIFAFNKGGRVTIPSLDTDAFVAKLLERRDRLRLRVELFAPFVTKELLRGNALAALEGYDRVVLDALVQVLWMRYRPAHYAFGRKYAHVELPREVAARLEHLSFVAGREELADQCREAVAWFREVVPEITETGVRSALAR